jgi:demethylmenaquinone methyltransferase/2-methoxy-6-polyprenyl-1,4-benzoquinol methylase
MAKKGVDLRRYNRIAPIYDLFEAPMELINFKRWRRLLFSLLEVPKHSLMLEVGIGTGKNAPYYPDSRIVAIDISRKMIEKARKRVRRLGKQLDLIIADVEALPFKDDIFDLALTTFVFCSVENPIKGLEELRRVLKKGSKSFFMEHMLPESRILQPIFHLLNPVVRLMGPEINRKTDKNVENSGFGIVEQRYLLGTVFRIIIAEKM